jgi:hypothetical protein
LIHSAYRPNLNPRPGRRLSRPRLVKRRKESQIFSHLGLLEIRSEVRPNPLRRLRRSPKQFDPGQRRRIGLPR